VWNRLARALLKINQPGEAIAAIKRQASLGETTQVWNNLGVAYYVKGDKEKAKESFAHALTIKLQGDDDGFNIAATNYAAVLTEQNREPSDVLKFIESVFGPERFALFAKRHVLSRMFHLKFINLVKANRVAEALSFGEWILVWPESSFELRTRMATNLIASYSLGPESSEIALELARQFSPIALEGKFENDEERAQLLNNIAFVFAERGMLDLAAIHLQALSAQIHKSPYPTATSGLWHFKKGHLDRADKLYSEALKLAINTRDKARIRQKWNLELGKASLEQEPSRAHRFLIKALNEKAEFGVTAQAEELLKLLKRRLSK
jgi:tetratricopeptide (TPR) repeat protein